MSEEHPESEAPRPDINMPKNDAELWEFWKFRALSSERIFEDRIKELEQERDEARGKEGISDHDHAIWKEDREKRIKNCEIARETQSRLTALQDAVEKVFVYDCMHQTKDARDTREELITALSASRGKS